ncbi:AAA family ATPase [Streptomyces sp. SL13]|uniref:AAA family ATPase n=1 Tax=Streptantibioticus silvisoli TaxID=2705255 RepID=A0AA90GV16_9ACTN|nr:LuxR family transcriptional regulator [Streptantibioticus silvisoli]MDI5968598.1 AAA family ATPase [Streptantibioticus silvisoli]
MVERTRELNELADLLAPSRTGGGRFAAVSGPRGCGRSALLETASETARASGLEVVAVRASVASGGESCVDLVGAVRAFVGRATGVVPGVDIAELTERLIAVVRSTPVLLVVDDAHLASPESLALLCELSHRAKDAPIGVLLSHLPSYALVSCDVDQAVLRSSGSTWQQLEVGPLSVWGVAELAAARLGREPTQRFVQEVFEVTGGNPLLTRAILEDTVMALARDAEDPVFGSRFNRTVLAYFDPHRCAAMTEVASAVAVLGPRLSLLKRLSRMVDLELGVVHRVLDGVAASGVFGRGLTLHSRISDVLLRSTRFEEARRLNLRAAEVLHDDGMPAEVVAEHLLASGEAPQPWGVRVLRDGAEQAALRHHHRHAAALLELALQAGADEETATEIRARLADLAWRTDPVTVADRLGTLTDAARRGGLGPLWIARLARWLTWLGDADAAEEMLGLVRERPGLDARTRIEVGVSDFWIRHVFPGVSPDAGEGEQELRPEFFAGDFAWLPSASRLPLLLATGKHAAMVPRAQEILQRVRPSTTDLEAAQAAVFSLLAAEHCEPVAPRFAGVGSDSAAADVPPQWSAMVAAAHAVSSLWQGRPADVVRSADQALDLLDVTRWGVMAGLPLGLRLLAMTEQARHREVDEVMSRTASHAFARSPYGLVYLRARGRHHAATGRHEAAMAEFRTCGEILASWRMELPGLLPWRLDLAEVLLRLDRHQQARPLIDEHLDLLGTADTRSRGIALRLLARTVPLAQRAAALRKSANILEKCGDPLELARTLGVLSRTYRTADNLPAARRVLGRAEILARSCGGDLAMTEDVIFDEPAPAEPAGHAAVRPARRGIGRHQPVRRHAVDPALTSAQERVAELAAEGYTNREIAGVLCVTVSTVEQHLTSVYRKFNIRRRSELAEQLTTS